MIHDEQNHLSESFQDRTHTQFSSTETALFRVENHLPMAVDTKGAALPILLDLSAAFNTIDPTILLNRLQNMHLVCKVLLLHGWSHTSPTVPSLS